MPLKSDLTLDAAKFASSSVAPKTTAFTDSLIRIMEDGPKWFEIGAEKYRQMRWNGETPLPKPVVLEAGQTTSIPSRDPGRSIPCRVFHPAPGAGASRGIFLHIHGGGWVLQSEAYQDVLLAALAAAGPLTVISIGYRLAPEHPFPAGPQDCYDATTHLADAGRAAALLPDAGPLLFIGGESAGGHLSMLCALHLLQNHPDVPLRGGLVLNFGAYDIAGFLPAVHAYGERQLVLSREIMHRFVEAFLPGTTVEQRRDPAVSPFYADLRRFEGRLPHALFTIGTDDPLLDDSVLMAAKWQMAGGDATLKVYPGGPHGLMMFPAETMEPAGQSMDDMQGWMRDRVAAAAAAQS